MKILLVYPPGSYVDMPTLGLACLQAHLRANGYTDIRIWESNLEYLEAILDPAALQRQEQRISRLDIRPEQAEVAARVRFLLPHLRECIRDAVQTFRDPKRYYDVPSFNRAVSVVQFALESYSLNPEPLRHEFNSGGFLLRVDPTQVPFAVGAHLRLAQDLPAEAPLSLFAREKARELAAAGPFDLVGFSCANPQQLFPTFVLARALREAGAVRKIVLGGSFTTASRRSICETPEIYDLIDYVVTFEGENALLGLVRALEEGRVPFGVPNLHHRQEGRLLHQEAEKIGDLNELPTPDFTGYPLDRYWTPEPVLPAYSTRGCFYDICSFCNHHENYFGQFRSRALEKVLDDLETYKRRYDCNKVFFVDELMIPAQQVEIAKGITSRKLGTKWYAHARVAKQLTKERLQTLSDGGLTLLHVGMESANTRVLELMKKGYDRATVLKFLEDLKSVPITTHLNTILGFPGEQPDEYIETLDTALDFARVGDYIHLYDFGLDYGAPIEKEGSPFLEKVRRPPGHDLNNHFLYERVGVRPPTNAESEELTTLRNVLKQTLALVNEVFPKECCWAAHLLYVAKYRAEGKGALLDQQVTEAGLSAAHLQIFREPRRLSEGELSLGAHVITVELPTSAGKGWHVLDLDHFALLPVSAVTAEWLKKGAKKQTEVSNLLPAAGVERDRIVADLYLLARARTVRVTASGKKRSLEGL